MSSLPDSGPPYFAYVYDAFGYHHGGVRLEDGERLKSYLESSGVFHAYRRGLEIRVTDCLDYLIFHCDKGKVLWPNEA